jgi:Secretion system C-terminal sorting domain
MKSKYYILAIGLLLSFRPYWVFSQPAPTIWVTGTEVDNGEPGYGNAFIHFGENGPEVIQKDLGMRFESTVATMTDSSGNLLFYTNGCFIANGSGDMIENGDGLNPGQIHNWTCATEGYISPSGAVAVLSPERAGLYYLFHIGVAYTSGSDLDYGPFYYTVIDMEANGGAGKVLSKNNILVAGTDLGPFSVTRHANGRDWWAVIPEAGSNRYHKTLLTASGMRAPTVQAIGTSINCRSMGASVFSLDGTRFARQKNCGLQTFRFDRCSGELSEPLAFPFGQRAFGGGGVQFSPDGNKVFTNLQIYIMGADLTQSQPVLDTVVSVFDLLGNNLHQMQYGPDGKIYFSTMAREAFMHVIDAPDSATLVVQQRGLKLPVYQMRTLPNLPNYALGRQSDVLCPDPYAGFNFQATTLLSPNPTNDYVVVRNPDQEMIQCTIYNMAGQLLSTRRFAPANIVQLTLGEYPSGAYYLIVNSINGERAEFKVVVTR